jgi:lipopolysaccharide export system protein LptA
MLRRARPISPVPTRSVAVLCCLFLAASGVRGQQEKVIVLNHADSLEGRVIDGEAVRELIGNVNLRQGRVIITCDRVLEYQARGQYDLNGHVVVQDSNTVIAMPRGVYRRAERSAEALDSVSLTDGATRLTARYGRYFVDPREGFFREDVRVVDSTSVITCDSLHYMRASRQSVATGRVTVVSPGDHVTIFGGLLVHDQTTAFSRMTREPVLVQVDTAGGGTPDTLVVRSVVMESYRDSTRRLLAIDSVRLAGQSMAGRAGFAEFFSRGDSILLRHQPVIWYERTQVSGDSIRIYLVRRRLERVLVTGTAIAVSESDSLHPGVYDQMVGDTMDIEFARQALHSIQVDVHAISVYHLYDDTTANGINRTSGDRIVMQFRDGRLRSIRVMGGVEGQYVPENMVRGHDESYLLPGAAWRNDRPRRSYAGGGITID